MQGATKAEAKEKEKEKVSIHAPYAGSDFDRPKPLADATMFQSTPPMQGAT